MFLINDYIFAGYQFARQAFINAYLHHPLQDSIDMLKIIVQDYAVSRLAHLLLLSYNEPYMCIHVIQYLMPCDIAKNAWYFTTPINILLFSSFLELILFFFPFLLH